MKSQTKKKLASLSSVTLVMVFGNSMIIPVFSKIQSALDISFFQVSLIVTYYSFAAAIFIPIFGFCSDHIKRKWVIIIALLLYGLGGSFIGLLAFFRSNEDIFNLILLGRVVQGIGAAGMSPIAMALVGDIFTSEERAKALGLIEFSNIFGKIISPILGSILALLTWFIPFFLYGVFVVPVLIGIIFFITEPENKNKTPFLKYFSDIKRIFTLRGKFLWVSYLGGWTSFFILFGILAFLSDSLENRYDIVGVLKGVVIAIPVTGWALSSFFSGYTLQKKTELLKWFVIAGFFILGLTSVLIPFFLNLYIILTLVFLMGLGGGLIIPSLTILVTNCAPTEERGGIMSLYGSIRFFGVALGPPSFSLLVDVHHKAPFIVASVLTFITLALFASFKIQEIMKVCKN